MGVERGLTSSDVKCQRKCGVDEVSGINDITMS